MATIVRFSAVRAVDINSFAVPGALATFMNSGTTAVRTVYADPDCTIPHPSPLEADGAGVFPPVYDVGGSDVKAAVTTPGGVMLAGYPMDPIAVVSTTAAGASGIAFNPTEEIPETNVQDAIERVQANIVEPLADFGLGVTGSATILANLDAVGTASGAYRFDATTIGSFPASVTATGGGIVRLWRANSSTAIMLLVAAGGRRHHLRALSGGSWGEWAYLMQSSDTVDNTIWAAGGSSNPQIPSPAGVMAAVRAQAVGAGQTWQNVARAAGTVYQNTTGRPIQVSLKFWGGSSARFQVSANGSTWIVLAQEDSEVQPIIPATWRYQLTEGTVAYWAELR